MLNKIIVFDLGLKFRFRGITRRQGILIKGEYGWAEWSPFLDYDGKELLAWQQATLEIANNPFPEPVRTKIPVNVTVGALGAVEAHKRVRESGCETAKIKVAEPGQNFSEDQARIEAVKDALGPNGRIRIDVNGLWGVDEAYRNLKILAQYDLEYVEQPCATTEELAELRVKLLRGGVSIPIAADESIRRADDPIRVRKLAAADIAVLKVQPLGGIRACLRWAEELDIPVVVSSAIETSVGLRAGLALAAALPSLPYACGLNTANMLEQDVVVNPIIARQGKIELSEVTLRADLAQADDQITKFWETRWNDTWKLAKR